MRPATSRSDNRSDNSGTVAVIGGGVIGASVAHHLAKKGWQVTVIEKDRFGRGSSWGNCGIILPSHVLPLSSIENLLLGMRWILRKDAPLRIALRADADFFHWLMRFALHCSRRRIHASALGLSAMLNYAVPAFEALIREENLRCNWRRDGALLLFRSIESFRRYASVDAAVCRYGRGCARLGKDDLSARAPNVGAGVAGAWMDEQAASLRPDHLMIQWADALRRRGVTILEQTEFLGFRAEGSRARVAVTTQGDIASDAFVAATGAWTPLLHAALGMKIPIQPGKGYSVTLSGAGGFPSIPCFFEEARVVATPWDSGLRLGGTMEFSGYDSRLSPTRIRALYQSAASYLGPLHFGAVQEEWCGWRPMTADGLPVIDFLPGMKNVLIAAGHNMLGITMAPATGKLAAEMLSGETPHIDPFPYRISKYQ